MGKQEPTPVGVSLHLLMATYRGRFEQRCKSVTYAQAALLIALLVDGSALTQKDVGARIGMDRSTTNATLHRLSDLRLVSMTRSEEDTRCIEIRLTALGRDAANIARNAMRDVERTFKATTDHSPIARVRLWLSQ